MKMSNYNLFKKTFGLFKNICIYINIMYIYIPIYLGTKFQKGDVFLNLCKKTRSILYKVLDKV